MAGENAAGAPTVGLGQTVTFGFKQPGVVAARPTEYGRLNGGLKGDAGGATMQPANMPNPRETKTLELLGQAANAAIGKSLEKARVEQWVNGMQRAMSGEAVEDIVNERPAWARVFGDSDVVEGARAYQQEQNVQRVLLGIEEEMPELRKLPPDVASKEFAKRTTSAMTGNAATDMAIMQSLQRNLPAVLKRQATAHYGWKQEEAAKQEANAIDTAAQRLQLAGKQVAAGTLSEGDFNEQAASFGLLTVPPLGRDPHNFAAQRTDSMINMAEQGQFHALNAMEKIGLFEVLSPAQKTRIDRSRQANELQYRGQWATENAERLAAIRRLSERPLEGMRASDVVAYVRDVNTDWRRDTGSKTDFFDGNVIAAYGERTAQAIQAAHDKHMVEAERNRVKLLAAQDKEGARKVMVGQIADAYANGNVKMLTSLTKISEDDVNSVTTQPMLAAINNPLKAPEYEFTRMSLGAVGGYVNQAVKGRINQMVAGAVVDGQPSTSFGTVYEGWRRMYKANPEGTAMYYGEDNAKFLAFHLLHPDSIDPTKPNPTLMPAFATSFGNAASSLRGKLTGDKKAMAELMSAAHTELSYWRPEIMGGERDLRDDQKDALMRTLIPYAEAYGKLYDQPQAFKLAISTALANGTHFVGGYVWQDKTTPDFQAKVQNFVGKDKFAIPTGEQFGKSVGALLDKHGATNGIASGVNITAMPDGALIMSGLTKDFQQRVVRVSMDKIAEAVIEDAKKQRPEKTSAGEVKTWWRFGPEITYQAPEGLPAPGASEETWKAYRARQATKR